jgi:hypothetical protein
VFWVDGRSYDGFVDSYRDIARALRLEGWRDRQVDILRLVYVGLTHTKLKWLMVLDNADDLAMFRGDHRRSTVERNGRGTPASLKRYIPRPTNGSILITSRDKAVAGELARRNEIIHVDNMNLDEATRLWNVKYHGNGGGRYYRDLVARLGLNPLAICQAATYIESNPNRVTVRSYLRSFERMDGNTLTLLDTEPNQFEGDPRAPRATLKAWQRSIRQSWDDFPFSVHVLEVMSCYDRRGAIPISLLEPCEELFPPANRTIFDNALGRLEDQFFINYRTDGGGYDLHILVRLGIQKWLLDRNQLEQRRTDALLILSTRWPSEDSSDLETARALFLHVVAVLGLASEAEVSEWQLVCEFVPHYARSAWALLLQNLSWYLEEERMPALAVCTARKAMFILETHPTASPESYPERYLWSIVNLARRLESRGEVGEAELLRRRAMRWARSHFGKNHDVTVKCAQKLLGVGGKHQAKLSKVVPLQTSAAGYSHSNGNIEYPQIPQPTHTRLQTVVEMESENLPPRPRHSMQAESFYVKTARPIARPMAPPLAAPIRSRALTVRKLNTWGSLEAFTPRNYVPTLNDDFELAQTPRMEYARPRYEGRRNDGRRKHHARDWQPQKNRTEFDEWNENLCCPSFTDWWWNKLFLKIEYD